MEPLPYLDIIKQVVTVMFSLCFTAIVLWTMSGAGAEAENDRNLPFLEDHHG